MRHGDTTAPRKTESAPHGTNDGSSRDDQSEADRNHDGYVDAQEFEAIRKAHAMFKDADLGYFDDNRDGRLSRGEFVDKPNPLFARYDKKGTCRVTFDDIAAAAEKSLKGGARR